MSLPATLKNRLRLPLIAAPMFLVSGVELVVAACRNGVIGAFPTVNCRSPEQLDDWLGDIETRLRRHSDGSGKPAAPICPNLIVHRSNPRVPDDLAAAKSFRNLPSVHLLEPGELNAYDILCSDWVVFTRDALPGPAEGDATPATVVVAASPNGFAVRRHDLLGRRSLVVDKYGMLQDIGAALERQRVVGPDRSSESRPDEQPEEQRRSERADDPAHHPPEEMRRHDPVEHEVTIAPFRIAKSPVTNADFAAFVDDGGHRNALESRRVTG